MHLLVNYLEIIKLSSNPIFIVGNSAKSFFNDLNMHEFKNNQLIFIHYFENKLINESDFFSYDHQNYLNLDLNLLKGCNYDLKSLSEKLQLFFKFNKNFGSLTKINVVLSLDELLSQAFIDTLIKVQQNQHIEINLFVKKPKFSFNNILLEVEKYFEKCLDHFKNVISIESTNVDELYSIVKN